jgi:hypothetical protein
MSYAGLRQIRNPAVFLHRPISRIRRKFTGYNPHKRRFPGTIRSSQRRPGTLSERKTRFLQYIPIPKSKGYSRKLHKPHFSSSFF